MFEIIPSQQIIDTTITALTSNGFNPILVDHASQVKEVVQKLILPKSQVMTMSSVTLETTGITDFINESGEYQSVKKQLGTMDRKTQNRQMQIIGASPEWAVGSVNAITTSGQLIFASNTGSQLGPYAYTSNNVLWIVGAQKITTDLDTAFKRIYEYVLPMESIRVQKAYGMERSNVSKLLIINKEVIPNRSHIIIVKESLGY